MSSKEELRYISSLLICGDNSPRTSRYKVFNLDIFKKHKDLTVKITKLRKGEHRSLPVSNHTKLVTHSETQNRTNKFAPIITLVDYSSCISISDTVFNMEEFDIYDKDIKVLIDRKIEATADLIEAVYTKNVSYVPLLINDFPNICRQILDKSQTIFK
jgi:hypothetical protein